MVQSLREQLRSKMPEGRMCKHECPKGECTSCECFANVFDDYNNIVSRPKMSLHKNEKNERKV